jgi:hypothetical protein
MAARYELALNRMDWASVESWHECWLNAEIQLARQMRASAMQADQDERWRPSRAGRRGRWQTTPRGCRGGPSGGSTTPDVHVGSPRLASSPHPACDPKFLACSRPSEPRYLAWYLPDASFFTWLMGPFSDGLPLVVRGKAGIRSR